MIAKRRRPVRFFLAVALTAFFPCVASAAEFLEFYKNGIAAVESQHWTLAVEMMQKAIDEQPEARTRVKRSLYFRRYLPHFYLGKALYETGDCQGALAAWLESESQTVVSRFPEYQQILEGRVACGQMVDLEGALDEALQAVESAARSAAQSRLRLSSLVGSEAGVDVLRNRQSQAEASLSRVRQRLASVDIVLDEVEESATLAAIAKAEFDIIGQQAEDLRDAERATRNNEVVAQIQSLVASAEAELQASEYLEPYPATVARRRQAVEQALERSQAAADSSLNPGELQAIQSELAKVTRDLRRSVSPPPADLRNAAEAFMANDYTGVLTILGDREFASARATSHSHLLRAAALFSIYYSTGAGDETFLEQAADEVLACRRADRDSSPPASVFSPSFVAFFESQILEPVEFRDEEDTDQSR